MDFVTDAQVEGAGADPPALAGRLVTLCRNMTATIGAMAADATMGATR